MADTPRSEYPPVMLGAPMLELDDHRHQPESLPRTDTMGSSAQRSRRRSTSGAVPPIRLQVPESYGTVSRDFEHAIADDDRSDQGSVVAVHIRKPSTVSRHGGRRNTFKRNRNADDTAPRSRASSTSSSSSSEAAPNSVDAFADKRRRPRAGTAASQSPSFIARPAHSDIIKERRRTLSEDKLKDNEQDESVSNGSVEDDVCYPPSEEETKHFEIDFEDLEEFVLKKRAYFQDQPMSHTFISGKGHATHDELLLSPKSHPMRSPQSLPMRSPQLLPEVHEKRPSQVSNDGSGSTIDEKEKRHSDVDFSDHKIEPQFEHIPIPHNRWTFFSSEMEEARHRAELGDLLDGGESFQDLFDLGPDGGVWWLDMLMPTKEEVECICKAFHIHGLTREDIIQQEPREKVELFHTYYFLSFRSFYQEDKDSEHYMEPISVFAVVFRGGVLTFTFCPSPHAANVRRRIYKLRDYVSLSSDWICYALIDDIVDAFAPVILSVEIESEAIEDSVFTARAEDSRTVLRHIGGTRKKIMTLLRLLGGKADVIKGFAKRCNEQYSIAPRQEVGLYLSDIQDHVITMMGNLGHFEKILSRSHSNYLAQISVHNIAQGNRVSEALGKVTYIATILVPMNLICGLFGMNVEVPGKNATGLGWFFGIVGVLLFFAVAATVFLRRLRYI